MNCEPDDERSRQAVNYFVYSRLYLFACFLLNGSSGAYHKGLTGVLGDGNGLMTKTWNVIEIARCKIRPVYEQ